MLEIIFLIFLTRRIDQSVRAKGYQSSGGYKGMLVGLWFGGEILGVLIGVAAEMETGGLYALGLVGAGLGTWITFSAVSRLEPAKAPVELEVFD